MQVLMPPDALPSTAWHLSDSFAVLGETEDFLVVDKPAGLLIHPTKPNGPRTLWHGVQELLAYEVITGREIGILTRLDRETSGVVLIGKGRAAVARMGRMLQAGEVIKEYRALVFGWPPEERWTVEAPLLRLGEVEAMRVWLRRGVHPAGKPARTDFAVVRRLETPAGEKFALVAAWPRTGRTHQIRVHLAYTGTPIVGDKLYARGEECYLEFLAKGWTARLARSLRHERQALHAQAVEFCWEGQVLRWESPWPQDLLEWERREVG